MPPTTTSHPTPSLIDRWFPTYDVYERHATHVRAPATSVWSAIRSADFGRPLVVRALLLLRALPGVIASARRGRPTELRRRATQPITLGDFEAHGFTIVAEEPPRDLLIGLEGRFWSASGGLCAIDRKQFGVRITAGMAQAAWCFTITPRADASCDVTTETRVRCADAASRRRFLAYWAIVRPWSGLIRRYMLREIRRTAEAIS